MPEMRGNDTRVGFAHTICLLRKLDIFSSKIRYVWIRTRDMSNKFDVKKSAIDSVTKFR